MDFKSIYSSGISIGSFILILPLSYAINDFDSLFAEAQATTATTTNDLDIQNNSGMIDTFQIDGVIGSLVTDLLNFSLSENVSDSVPIYVLAGNWSMGVTNGELSYLQVDFIMGLEDGTELHEYSIDNLRNLVLPSDSQNMDEIPEQQLTSNLVLDSGNNYSLSLFGYADVLTDGTLEWQNVPLSINIFNGNTTSILLYPSDTENRFKGQPIYGLVTWILDANNHPIKPSIWAATP
jgi:hypothetical protein